MRTLQSFLNSNTATRWWIVRDGSCKLSVPFDPEPCDVVLADLAEDPHERENRAAWLAYKPTVSGSSR